MVIYPAIDIMGGCCVRLLQGKFESKTVYGADPVKMAEKWVSAGAKWLHVVDLDGARKGASENREIIYKIAKKVNIPVQMGGGIRTMDDISEVLSSGVERVILGTSAVKNPALAEKALREYPGRVAIGIDAKDGMVAIEGWEKVSGYPAVEFAKSMEQLGATVIIYTDIAVDGTLKGPNLKAMEKMIREVSMDVIASGGISSIDDLQKLKEIGVAGAITGKAIYTGTIDLGEAILKVSYC